MANAVQDAPISISEIIAVGQLSPASSMPTRNGATNITTSAEITALGQCRSPLVR